VGLVHSDFFNYHVLLDDSFTGTEEIRSFKNRFFLMSRKKMKNVVDYKVKLFSLEPELSFK